MSARAGLNAERVVPSGLPVVAAVGPVLDATSLSSFTIADFLAMDVTVQGAPVVVAARDELARRIRWLHVTELVDMRGLLQGGELILSTGIALPQSPSEIASYVDALADQGVAGLVIELGRRFAAAPTPMVRACERRRMPLIVLRREVQFVKLTEAAHSTILTGQHRLLQISARAHERFTELGVTGANAGEMVRAAGELADGEVIFSNVMHQVVAMHADGANVDELMRRWHRKTLTSRRLLGTEIDDADFSVTAPSRRAWAPSGTPDTVHPRTPRPRADHGPPGGRGGTGDLAAG